MSPLLGRRAAFTWEGFTAPRCVNDARPMREMKQCVWRCDVTKCGFILDAAALYRGWSEQAERKVSWL